MIHIATLLFAQSIAITGPSTFVPAKHVESLALTALLPHLAIAEPLGSATYCAGSTPETGYIVLHRERVDCRYLKTKRSAPPGAVLVALYAGGDELTLFRGQDATEILKKNDAAGAELRSIWIRAPLKEIKVRDHGVSARMCMYPSGILLNLVVPPSAPQACRGAEPNTDSRETTVTVPLDWLTTQLADDPAILLGLLAATKQDIKIEKVTLSSSVKNQANVVAQVQLEKQPYMVRSVLIPAHGASLEIRKVTLTPTGRYRKITKLKGALVAKALENKELVIREQVQALAVSNLCTDCSVWIRPKAAAISSNALRLTLDWALSVR
jgi:hypothetical protein